MQPHQRATFDAAELAVVLSYYDLGILESITDFPRGSRRSPKVGIVCERGKFLLKRRSIARANPERVRLAHRVQERLAAGGFPLAGLVPTRDGRDTLVQLRDHVYELFDFVAGQSYEHTTEESRDAGRTLARFHQGTEGWPLPVPGVLPAGDYHDAQPIRTGLCAIGSTLSSHDSFSGNEAELAALTAFLLSVYDRAAEAAEQAGGPQHPERLIHSDWHPGNLLFRRREVVAVVDFDSLRVSRRGIDVANGALQFSITAGGDPLTWPDHVDETRFQAFLSGYESLLPLEDGERRSLPHLMAEALIAECVPPITETGSVGRWAGFRVLQMVRRKLRWMEANMPRLIEPAGPPTA